MSENYGHLSRQLEREATVLHMRSQPMAAESIRSAIPEINRLERIVSALESIGVNLDETDISALELLASDPNYSQYRAEFYEEINTRVRNVQEIERDHEQEQAIESLATSGFVLNDEEETWTRGGETVKVTCDHPAESAYKWEYYNGHICEIGVSGEFHRLLALIGKKEVKADD
jgi:hypothetical protein